MRLHDIHWEPSDEDLGTLTAEIGADVRAQSTDLHRRLRLQVSQELAAARQRLQGCGLDLPEPGNGTARPRA